MENIDIKINGSLAEIELNENGSRIVKEVLVKDLLSALRETGSYSSTDFLPGEFGTHKIVSKGSLDYYLFSERPRSVDVVYDAPYYEYSENRLGDIQIDHEEYDDYDENIIEEYKTVAPIMVWMVSVYKQNEGIVINKVKAFSIKTPILTGNEKLHYIPFVNAESGGGICWGDVNLSATNVRSIQGLSTKFYSSNSNFELGDGYVKMIEVDGEEHHSARALHYQTDLMKKNGDSFEDIYNKVNEHLKPFKYRESDDVDYCQPTVFEYFDNFVEGRATNDW